MSVPEYRMTLGELTNTLQSWCHDGLANRSVELMIEQSGKRVYMSRPLLTDRAIPNPYSITLVMEDKTE